MSFGRFVLFGYDQFYPNGGRGDMIAALDSWQAVAAEIREGKRDHYDVLDTTNRIWMDVDGLLRDAAEETGERVPSA